MQKVARKNVESQSDISWSGMSNKLVSQIVTLFPYVVVVLALVLWIRMCISLNGLFLKEAIASSLIIGAVIFLRIMENINSKNKHKK